MAAGKITVEGQAAEDERVGVALESHLRGWLAHRLAAHGAKGVTFTGRHKAEVPGTSWAAVAAVARVGQRDAFAFAKARDVALAAQRGGRGRFLVTALAQHDDAVRCALNANLDALLEISGCFVDGNDLKHGIVDDKRVDFMLMLDGDPTLDVLRWMLA